MNNFSPSTDTSVGTKRFTAQEVQLAYTLMAVEYMKTIKGLNPNHQLVDKAVKLKALGFTNSKEVGMQFTVPERKIIPINNDPFVFQVTPIGVMIHSKWNIDTNKFHKVNVMMLSPNYWDEQGIGNKHYFFMLDDCKNPEPVRGFFNEYLNSELTPHRKVFEVLADKMKTPYQEHQLSGLGFSSTMRNSVIVKVDGTFSRTLKVNF